MAITLREFQFIKKGIEKAREEQYKEQDDESSVCRKCNTPIKEAQREIRVRRSTGQDTFKIEKNIIQVPYCPNCEKKPGTYG
jgi:uncharacterized protein with PIN domain